MVVEEGVLSRRRCDRSRSRPKSAAAASSGSSARRVKREAAAAGVAEALTTPKLQSTEAPTTPKLDLEPKKKKALH